MYNIIIIKFNGTLEEVNWEVVDACAGYAVGAARGPRTGRARDHGRADGLAKLLTKVARESGLLWRPSGS